MFSTKQATCLNQCLNQPQNYLKTAHKKSNFALLKLQKLQISIQKLTQISASFSGITDFLFQSQQRYIKIFIFLSPQSGSVAQLNRVSDYGSEGYRFESCRNHEFVVVET